MGPARNPPLGGSGRHDRNRVCCGVGMDFRLRASRARFLARRRHIPVPRAGHPTRARLLQAAPCPARGALQHLVVDVTPDARAIRGIPLASCAFALGTPHDALHASHRCLVRTQQRDRAWHDGVPIPGSLPHPCDHGNNDPRVDPVACGPRPSRRPPRRRTRQPVRGIVGGHPAASAGLDPGARPAGRASADRTDLGRLARCSRPGAGNSRAPYRLGDPVRRGVRGGRPGAHAGARTSRDTSGRLPVRLLEVCGAPSSSLASPAAHRLAGGGDSLEESGGSVPGPPGPASAGGQPRGGYGLRPSIVRLRSLGVGSRRVARAYLGRC